MKYIKIILLLAFINFIFIQTTNAQWVKQTNGLPTSWGIGSAIDASDSNTAVFVASLEDFQPDAVILTSDAGNTWKNITPLNQWNEYAIDVSIIDKDHIWIVTTAKDSARILHTSDGGETWIVQFNDSTKTQFFNYIKMFDLQNGVAMGDWSSTSDRALFLRTNDGGESWIEMENNELITGSADTWRRLDFVTPEIGYFSSMRTGLQNFGIMKTNDGGNNWDLLIPEIGVEVMKFYDQDIGLFKTVKFDSISNHHVLYRTINGGKTWEEFEVAEPGWGIDIEFIRGDPSQIWYSDNLSLFFSNDTGKTWTKNAVLRDTMDFWDIVFTDNKHGWILGNEGQLFYTNNNGGILTDLKNSKKDLLPTEFKLYQNFPNPFNPSTKIEFNIAKSDKVDLSVYNNLGERVLTLLNKDLIAGNYSVDFNGSRLASGIYYYKLSAGNFVSTKKMILIK